MNDFTRSKNGIYEHNVGILKQYSPNFFKLINLRAVRIVGYEERSLENKGKKNTASNTTKLKESLSRSKSKVFELAMCIDFRQIVLANALPNIHFHIIFE